MLLIRCQCGKKLRLRAEFAGKVGRCPACGRDVQVPSDLPVDGEARAAPRSSPGMHARGSEPAAPRPSREAVPGAGADDLPEVDHDALTEHEMKPGVGAAADAWKRDREARRAATRKATGELPRAASSSASGAAVPVSRDAMTAREPMRAANEALAAWRARGGSGTTNEAPAPAAPKAAAAAPRGPVKRAPLANASPPITVPRETLSLHDTARGPGVGAPEASPSTEKVVAAMSTNKASSSPGGKPRKPAAPASGASPKAAAAPEPAGGRAARAAVPATAPLVAAASHLAVPLTEPSRSAAATLAPPEPLGPWYDNETFVVLLLLFCYPLGVLGVLLGRSWASAAQKVLVLLSLAGMVGLGLVTAAALR